MDHEEAQAWVSRTNPGPPAGILKEFIESDEAYFRTCPHAGSSFALTVAARTSPAPAARGARRTAQGRGHRLSGRGWPRANEFQRDFADLQKKYEPKRTQLKTQTDEIEGLEKQLQAQGDKLSEAARASQTKTIDDKKKLAQRFAEDAQNDLTGEMNDLYNKIASKVFDVLNSYSTQHGFTLVVDDTPGQQQAPVVLYHAENTDISKAIVEVYNTKSGVPAPPPQAAAPPDAPKAAPKTPAAH